MKTIATWITLGGFCVGAAAALVTRPVLAQAIAPLPAQGLQQQDANNFDFFTETERDSSASLLNLINQIQLLNGRTPAEFDAEQSENLNAAAAKFRSQQLQRIQPQPQPAYPMKNSPASAQ